MEESRQDPDKLLHAIQKEEEQKSTSRGHLKIFFGYAAGVGKTYAMLSAAHAAKQRGLDVVVGYVEPHARPETSALLNGLEVLPTLDIEYKGLELHEVDIDGAIKRNPQILLVDEFAHTNAEGSRHVKRYQDVEEILQAGIDVYTTLNVQHIESLNDTVASITGVFVHERIPDSVFDDADMVELVDIEPKDLIDRLNSGNVYRETQAERAVENFFTIDNLTALREIALRRCADRMTKLTDNARIKNRSEFRTDEHILVCLSPSSSNAKIIRSAARMRDAYMCALTALFVETPDFSDGNEERKRDLRQNMDLAEQFGATVETVYGDDVAYQISEFARLSGVTIIVMGRSSVRSMPGRRNLSDKVIAYAPNMDVHVIPDTPTKIAGKPEQAGEEEGAAKRKKKKEGGFNLGDVGKCVLILASCCFIGALFQYLDFYESNIIMVFVLGVVLICSITGHQAYGLISSVVSVLAFDFFFTEPQFTLVAYGHGYPVTFVIMFLVAFLTGSLAIRLRENAKQASKSAYRTTILFDTNQLLQKAESREEIVSTTCNQLVKLLGKDVVIYMAEDGRLSKQPKVFSSAEGTSEETYTTKKEEAVAEWVFKNNRSAGATTDTLPDAKCLYLSLRVNENVYGVVGIVMRDDQILESFESNILLSLLDEGAMALENDKNEREKEEAAVMAKNEQIRANLLRAVSHDLRTPLTSISGNASNLLSNDTSLDRNTKQRLYLDIYDDSMWLNSMVEDLLTVARIEEGRLNLRISTELVEDTITEALHHVNRRSVEHHITVEQEDEFLMAKMDGKLIVQVIINIVDNAIQYTPVGSHIVISTWRDGDWAVVSVADDGYGVSDDAKALVFDMFYTGDTKIADGCRSSGLGLSICKSIVDAHGGELTVTDNVPHGAVFTFTLPVGEVEIDE